MPNKMKSNNPPRRVEIRGQDHLLAYITPDEAQLLMDNGGSGEPGPMGIPAYPKSGGGYGGGGKGGFGGGSDNGDFDGGANEGGPEGYGGSSGKGSDGPDRPDVEQQRQTSAAETAAAAAKAAEMAAAKGPAGGGISPGQSQAMFGTPQYAGLGTEQAISAAKSAGNQFAGGVEKARAIDIAALQNLNRQLEELSRRERVQQDRLNSPLSLIPGVGLANYLGLQNVRNIAAAAIGSPPGLLGSFGFDERVSPEFGGLGVSDLVGLQSQAITDDMGNLVGFRDEYGNVSYGTDPDAGFDGDGPEVAPTQTNPVTGQEECPEGYVFDEDLQACRLDTALQNVGDTGFDYEPGIYARMGLLDVAPQDLGGFASTYDTGFGTPQDFEAANLAYRRQAGTQAGIFQDPYNLQGYTLLA